MVGPKSINPTPDIQRLNLYFCFLDDSPLYKRLEIKQLRDDGMRVLHYVCEIEANVNGTLEELRTAIVKKTFLKKQKMLFLTSKLETVHPSKEVDVKVKEIFKTAVKVKILHGTGTSKHVKFALF